MNQIINIGIMAHVDAGKTTVTEQMLYLAKAIRKPGRVDHGDTKTDSMELEQERGMTIRSATVSLQWKDKKLNLLDTPGHMDFISEVERSFAVLDGAVLVVSAREGVQAQTKVICRQLQKFKVPFLIFVNKIDRVGVDLSAIEKQLRQELQIDPYPMEQVTGAGTQDCSVTELQPDQEEQELLQELWKQQEVTPVFFGAALKEVGVEELMNGVCTFLEQKGDQGVTGAYCYHILFDEKHHKKCYFRVYGRDLQVREKTTLQGTNIQLKNLWRLGQGKEQQAPIVSAGDIAMVYDLENVNCGSFLGAEACPDFLSIHFAEPILTSQLLCERENRAKLLSALEELSQEDPSLQIRNNSETEMITIQLFGLLQMEVISELLNGKYQIPVTLLPPKTIYKYQPAQKAMGSIRMCEKENHCQAGIVLTLEPTDYGTGFQYENQVSYGDLSKSYQQAVFDGITQYLKTGMDLEVTDLKVTFLDMDYDSVGSTPAEFRRLAPLVMDQALTKAQTRCLEPMMHYELTVPKGFESTVLSALAEWSEEYPQITYQEELFMATGNCRYDLAKDFSTQVLHETQGKGVFQMKLEKYVEKKQS